MSKLSIEDCKNVAIKNGGLCLSEIYINNKQRLLWQCSNDHRWYATIHHIRNHNSWCRKCFCEKRLNSVENCKILAQRKNGKFLSLEYKGAFEKYLWECSEGHRWQAKFNNIQQGQWCPECEQTRRENTCFLHNGVINPMKNPKILQKASKSSKNSYIFHHWKTGDEIICTASYEKRVVEYFNKNKIDFVWQLDFQMPDGRVYIVDGYLPEKDIYIEIKGYIRNFSREKWEWFRKEHPNSELWDKEKLKEMRIF